MAKPIPSIEEIQNSLMFAVDVFDKDNNKIQVLEIYGDGKIDGLVIPAGGRANFYNFYRANISQIIAILSTRS